jgi:hypothetical protein
MIGKLDFVAIPSRDSERSRSYYLDTLGLAPDEHGRFEVWAGDTCFAKARRWTPGSATWRSSPIRMATT